MKLAELTTGDIIYYKINTRDKEVNKRTYGVFESRTGNFLVIKGEHYRSTLDIRDLKSGKVTILSVRRKKIAMGEGDK